MGFKDQYPDFAAIEAHVRRARVERSVYVAHVIASFLSAIVRGFEKLGCANQLAAIADRQAIEADAFLKRWVPKY